MLPDLPLTHQSNGGVTIIVVSTPYPLSAIHITILPAGGIAIMGKYGDHFAKT